MNKKSKLFSISIIVVLGFVLFYFGIKIYSDNQYADKLPNIPDLEGASLSFKNYLIDATTKVKNKPSSNNLGELGMVYQSNNYFKEAETCYLLAIEREPENWKWNYYLGCLKRELGDSEKAIRYFNTVLKINSTAYMASYYLGEAYSQMGLITKAEGILKRLSAMDKAHFVLKNSKRTSYFSLPIYAHLEWAKINSTTHNKDLAEKQLKTLINKQVTFSPAYKQLSIIYAEKGDTVLSKYYRDRSKDLNIYSSPVDTLLDKLSFYSKSETYLLKQIEDARRSSNSLWALELVTLGLKNIPESKYITSKAIKQFIDMNAVKRALPLLPNHIIAFSDNYQELIEVGMGLANSKQFKEAQAYFMAAENVSGEKPETRSTLAGMYYEKLGMKDKAIAFINQLLKENPNNTSVISDAVFLFLSIEDIKQAKQYLTQLKKIDSTHLDIHVLEGIICMITGNETQSIKHFELAFKVNPEKKFVIDYLETYYQKNKMWSNLLGLYQSALKKFPNDSNIQEAYGSLMINCPDETIRDLNQAKEFSERAFINNKYTLQTRVMAGRSLSIAHFKLKNYGRAVYYIHETIDIAKRARFTKDYIASLEQISSDFQELINFNK